VRPELTKVALPARRARGRVRTRLDGLTIAGATIIAFWVVVAVSAPLLAPYEPSATDVSASLRPPLSEGHLLGTDQLGRDLFTRVVFAARVDLSMGVIGVVAPFVLGSLLGVVAGYAGGKVDTALMRLVDVMLAFPFLVMVLAVVAILGPGLRNYFVALAIVAWVPYARLVRAETLVLRRSEFVEAAQTLAYPRRAIVFRHVLPNAITPAAVFVITDIVLTILLGAALSFYGLGAQPPTAEWGRMIAEGEIYQTTAWWLTVIPGTMLILLTLGFSLLGDGLARQLRVQV
jgi:peptide/nickel transport system permease protein